MHKMLAALTAAVCLAVAIAMPAAAQERLNGAQLDYLMRGAVWKLEGICPAINTPSPWKGEARFAADGGFEASTECAHPWEPQWPRYKGAWSIEGDALCFDGVSANGAHNMHGDAFRTGDCFEVGLDDKRLVLTNLERQIDWKFHYLRHPAAADFEALKAKLPPAS